MDAYTEPDAPEHPLDNGFYREVANWQLRHRGLAVPILQARTDTGNDTRTDARTEGEIAEPLIRQIEAFARNVLPLLADLR